MSNDSLGDRMKRYELVSRQVLPPRTYAILRVDGKSFHSYTKGLQRPFDPGFMNVMDGTARELASQVQGAFLAYVQSDEISVVFSDLGSQNSEMWLGGVHAKITSIGASIATAAFNSFGINREKWGLFDARVFALSTLQEVANYLLWRQNDARRNSIMMVAQSKFSHKDLHGVSAAEAKDMLWSNFGIDWSEFPTGQRQGRVAIRETRKEQVNFTYKVTGEESSAEVTRRFWKVDPAPYFDTKDLSWLNAYCGGSGVDE